MASVIVTRNPLNDCILTQTTKPAESNRRFCCDSQSIVLFAGRRNLVQLLWRMFPLARAAILRVQHGAQRKARTEADCHTRDHVAIDTGTQRKPDAKSNAHIDGEPSAGRSIAQRF